MMLVTHTKSHLSRMLSASQEEMQMNSLEIPAEFKRLLANDSNKERVFEVVEEVWKEEL